MRYLLPSASLLAALLALTAFTAEAAGTLRERAAQRIAKRAAPPEIAATTLRPGERITRPGRYRITLKHDGIERFTVGQRKGLGVAAGERRYVLEIVPADNTVVLGRREDLLARGLVAARVNWLLAVPPAGPLPCQARIRYRHTPVPAVVEALPDGGARAEFAEPESAVTPGQAVVFYDGPRVLGGGWIERALPPG